MDRAAGQPFQGLPIVGTFFWNDGTETGRFCGGTVVKSPGKNIVMSAGHCFDDQDARKNLAFVPQYDDGKKPHGSFTVKSGHIYVDKRYLSKGPDAAADLDFNFLQLEPRGGKNVEDVVGGAELVIRTVSTARSRSRSPTGSGRTPPSWAPATTRTTATRTTSWCGGPTLRCPCTRIRTRPARSRWCTRLRRASCRLEKGFPRGEPFSRRIALLISGRASSCRRARC
ncbi:trypsin-like serine protease [Streptomyces atratus]|uniref:trypsin-like serine protease n=1 Tax=Streptomyces atratus TaxID=1893 RepID=UPI0036CA05C9